ncbi:MAG TPA: LamG-like jellyroll fold domain-containing protein, partial [Candidatus Tyrphobacter sp.]|nr:LamG-like jellyroll fold domain-containing protein [Candidatus Tyrphobacter sp.]
GSGAVAYDKSGWGNNGNLEGATDLPTWTTSNCLTSSPCLSFDGTDDYVNAGSYGNSFDVTYTAWEKGTSTNTENIASVGFYDSFDLNAGGSTQLFFHSCYNGDTEITVNSNININDGGWHFVALGYQSGVSNNLIADIDGQTSIKTITGGPYRNTGYTYISNDQCNGQFNPFNGTLENIRIYNRLLSSSQIQAIYNAKQ